MSKYEECFEALDNEVGKKSDLHEITQEVGHIRDDTS